MIARRAIVAVAGAAALSLAMAGCGAAGNDAGKAAGGKTEVRMLVNITPNLTDKWWNELVAPFEAANPDIDVKIMAPVGKNVKESMPQLLASGDVPDVVQSLLPTKDLVPELVDLSAYEWAKSAPLASQNTFDGKYYIAGIGTQLQSIFFYNKKAFADAGIKNVPVTMDEFDADLQKLKDAGWMPLQTGGDWFTKLLPEIAGLPSIVAKNPQWYQDMSAGKVTFSQTYTDTLNLYASWVKKGYVPADAVGVKYSDAEQQFLAGKTAIYPMGSWFSAAEAKSDGKTEVGVFASPGQAGVTNPKMGSGLASPYMLMKAGKHQDAAAKLVEYLVTDKASVTNQLQVDGNFRDGFEYPMNDLAKELQKINAETPAADFIPVADGFGDMTLPSGYGAEFNTQMQGILTGGPVSTATKNMDSWFDNNR